MSKMYAKFYSYYSFLYYSYLLTMVAHRDILQCPRLLTSPEVTWLLLAVVVARRVVQMMSSHDFPQKTDVADDCWMYGT